jgi:diguanylate cyclase (GGDEF)-like protein
MDLLDQYASARGRHTVICYGTVGLLIALLMLGGDAILHREVNRLARAQNQVEIADIAQIDVEGVLHQVELFDLLARQYLQAHSPATLLQARTLAAAIELSDSRLGSISTSPEILNQLNACVLSIVRATESAGDPDSAFLDRARQNCDENLTRIRAYQRDLWRQHSEGLKEQIRSLRARGISFAALTTSVVFILLAMFARETLFRESALRHFTAANERWASAIEVLGCHAREMKLLGDARDQLQMCISAKDAYEVCVHSVALLIPDSGGALCMIDNSRQMIEMQHAWGNATGVSEIFPLDACCALRTGQARWRTPEASVVNCSHFSAAPPPRYVCLPLVANGDTLGILYIECAGDEIAARVERNLDPLGSLLQLAAMTVAGLNLRAKLENQSIRDSLTGLFNRHFMEITLERELRRATRKNTSLAVFMIDADNFKQFNDTFGHKAGDIVLRGIADRFLSSVRTEDIVCRYGGEEFVIILPDISTEKAIERAESIRQAILSLRVADHGQSLGAVTISIGVAVYPGDGDAIDQLLQAADRRLYAAKNNGRNQVVSVHQAGLIPIAAR